MKRWLGIAVMTAVIGVWHGMGVVNQEKEETMKPESCPVWTEEELKQKLTPEQYRIVRENGTESPFQNAYWNNKEPGIYVDVISGQPLFSSLDKFDSGTGWPSFTQPIETRTVVEKSDTTHGMRRTEVRSQKSDAHLGHVFDDGPGAEGLRYCINSGALRFIPLGKLEEEGYGEYVSLFDKNTADTTQTAIFGAGCFWGVEETFRNLSGVVKTTVGYAGGDVASPTYQQVCSGKTGHAEVVRVEYDSSKVSYAKLLEVFWQSHNPTTLNRQGPDVGAQYRSVIFYTTPEQKEVALASKAKAQEKFKNKIVTQIESASPFYPAEEYHQQYLAKHGAAACSVR